MNRYKNPWWKSANNSSPEFYENNAKKIGSYRGIDVFEIFSAHFDFVKDGTCVTQRAGITKYKKAIDNLLDGEK